MGYKIMFHAMNNLLRLGLMVGMQWLMDGPYQVAGSAAYSQTGSYSFSYNLASAGIYVAMTGIALVLIYAGNFLIHMGRKGYE